MAKTSAENVRLTKDGVTRTFSTPSDVVKARHDGWLPAGAKPSEPSTKAAEADKK